MKSPYIKTHWIKRPWINPTRNLELLEGCINRCFKIIKKYVRGLYFLDKILQLFFVNKSRNENLCTCWSKHNTCFSFKVSLKSMNKPWLYEKKALNCSNCSNVCVFVVLKNGFVFNIECSSKKHTINICLGLTLRSKIKHPLQLKMTNDFTFHALTNMASHYLSELGTIFIVLHHFIFKTGIWIFL